MTPLATILMEQVAPSQGASSGLRWLSNWLPDAAQIELTEADLARINAYGGEAADLHALLPAITPLAGPVWVEATSTASDGDGPRMIFGYGAVPAGEAIDIGWACWSSAHGRLLVPLGPARMTTTWLVRPAGISDLEWRALRGGAGIVIRAILVGIVPTRSPACR